MAQVSKEWCQILFVSRSSLEFLVVPDHKASEEPYLLISVFLVYLVISIFKKILLLFI